MIDVDEAERACGRAAEEIALADTHVYREMMRCVRALRSAAFEAAATEMTRIAVERGHTNSMSVRLFVKWCKRGGRSLAAKEKA